MGKLSAVFFVISLLDFLGRKNLEAFDEFSTSTSTSSSSLMASLSITITVPLSTSISIFISTSVLSGV